MTATFPIASVVAVVVTYNPDSALQCRLQILRSQVGTVLVVDNGSDNARFVESAAKAADCRIILNGKNLGLAGAHNQGARIATELGATWLAMFDQDSLAPADAISKVLGSECEWPQDQVAILAMSHSDIGTGRDYHRPGEILEQGDEWRRVRTTISSGSLVRVLAFRQIGMFDDKLFVDMVDIDFCMRCRKHGLLVLENRAVSLAHALGNSSVRQLLGRSFVLTHHSPLRRYYITRNQLEMCRRYARTDLRWTLGTIWDLLSGSMLVLLLEEQRWQKLNAMCAGARDFVLRRFGPQRRLLKHARRGKS